MSLIGINSYSKTICRRYPAQIIDDIRIIACAVRYIKNDIGRVCKNISGKSYSSAIDLIPLQSRICTKIQFSAGMKLDIFKSSISEIFNAGIFIFSLRNGKS